VTGALAGAAAAGLALSQGFRPGHGLGLLPGALFTWLALAVVSVVAIEFVRRHRRTRQVPRPVLVTGALAGAAAAGLALWLGFRPGHGLGLLPGALFTWLALAVAFVVAIELGRTARSRSRATVPAVPAPAGPGGADQPARDLPEQGNAWPMLRPPSGPDPGETRPLPGPAGRGSGKPAARPVPPAVRGAAAKVIRVPLVRGEPPATWAALIAEVSSFVPEDDDDLLTWFREQIIGMNGYAEALADVYEACFAQVGLVPAAIGAVHDTADAVAEASGTMAEARQAFAEYFAGFRQWAADGGEAPFDGRWVTGEGDDT